MKPLLLKGAAMSIMFTMLFTGSVFASESDHDMEKVIDGVKIHLYFMDKDIKTGANDIMVTLTDGNTNPIVDAKVTVVAEMDTSMAGMEHSGMKPPESLQAEPQSDHGKGQYMARVQFTDEGKWTIKLNVTADGRESVVDFTVNVLHASPNWYVIFGFLGIIAAIITGAALIKKRNAVHRYADKEIGNAQ